MGETVFPHYVENVIGGEKEEPTRKMILAGKAWLDSHPGIVPQFEVNSGVMQCLNNAAIELMMAILAVAPLTKIEIDGKEHDSCDEAMLQTAINHCSFIRNWTWEGYLKAMTPVKRRCTCSGSPPYNINCMSHGHLVPRGPLLS